ncbi:MAG: hypothetical protein HFH52_03450 [Lachnospiraceae bacterium]|nr:hypothetical protein [Lachnospiraceae bacterium]
MELTEKNRQNLQSDTWSECRRAMKETEPDANAGIQRRIAEGYLRTGYGTGAEGKEILVSGIAYKVLEKDKVTTFYDAEGNTLFSLENKRLAEMNGYLAEDKKPGNGTDASAEKTASVKQEAIKKLEKEQEAAGDKEFAEPVIRYLLKRCEEDEGLSQDVMQGHKTWTKCVDYIYRQARKQVTGNYIAIRDETVYEWAEDYYHKDDKAEEEEKAKKEEEAKKRATERATKAKENACNPKTDNKAAKEKKKSHISAVKAEEKRTRKNNKDLEGQMDMFSMMGM